MVSHSGLITVMTRAARKAAPRLRRDYGEVEQLQVSKKGPADFVSMADKRAEQTVLEELRNARPDWGLLCEECGEIAGDPSKPRWIVDPLDGTTNFLHGVPHFAISIAVEEPLPGGKRGISHGLVYQPLTDETFWAEKGRGAALAFLRIILTVSDACPLGGGVLESRQPCSPRESPLGQRRRRISADPAVPDRRFGAVGCVRGAADAGQPPDGNAQA
jgi:myo-inositol-1(or 4)-monophosphatase